MTSRPAKKQQPLNTARSTKGAHSVMRRYFIWNTVLKPNTQKKHGMDARWHSSKSNNPATRWTCKFLSGFVWFRCILHPRAQQIIDSISIVSRDFQGILGMSWLCVAVVISSFNSGCWGQFSHQRLRAIPAPPRQKGSPFFVVFWAFGLGKRDQRSHHFHFAVFRGHIASTNPKNLDSGKIAILRPDPCHTGSDPPPFEGPMILRE